MAAPPPFVASTGRLIPPPALLLALREARRALRQAGVPHALAGGLAVNLWGRDRRTDDVDFAVVVDSLDGMRSLILRLQASGFLAVDPRPMFFPRAWVGRALLAPGPTPTEPQPLIVDLVRPLGRGAESWLGSIMERAVEVPFEAEPLRVVAPEDLVLFKLLVQEDRGYDLDDARSVIERVGRDLDRRYLVRAALRLGIRTRLRRLGV